jgi:hypothetical protein
MLLVGTMDA